eukprot:CAMPEP_0185036228 /NCGR_PEP_ID=MMETSP1103-20130426/28867_1 /TAXON_ID=36769 /ORGANISM="Paraphysomonas bandaiensis, Strain Caron Lab Isolate" /LENGTH=1031 /DNA_ID=CAMNT_0027573691 /DNA_START=205 /DNA_END=3300 /DNA_ORIENTATION=-
MEAICHRYVMEGVEDFDIGRINAEIGDEVCLLIPRIIGALESALQRKEPFGVYVRSVCALLSTHAGQECALSSSAVIPELLRCIQCESYAREDDIAVTLTMLRRVCTFSDRLRMYVIKLHGMEWTSSLMQRPNWSGVIHSAGCALMLDLATVGEDASQEFSSLLRMLLNTPYLLSKHAAIRMISSALVTKSSARIVMRGWEEEVNCQIARVLLCAPIQYQYDTGELISLLFEDPAMSMRMMTLCSAVLCLRYTVGGGSICTPKKNWDLRFPPPKDSDVFVSEVPEVLICSILMSALSWADDAVSGPLEERRIAQGKFHSLATRMRMCKLHRILLAHILWYIREKTVLHKVLSIWNVGGSSPEKDEQQSGLPHMHSSRFRKAVKVAKKWISRRAVQREQRLDTPPELHRASVILRQPAGGGSESDDETTGQDLSCINAIRVLQKWIEHDPLAHQDIESDFARFGYARDIAHITIENTDEVLDILQSVGNVVRTINAQGQATSQVGKKSFLSNYLSHTLSPGELVKDLKVSLGEALRLDKQCVYPLEPPSTPSFSSSSCASPAQLFSDSSSTTYMPPLVFSSRCTGEGLGTSVDERGEDEDPLDGCSTSIEESEFSNSRVEPGTYQQTPTSITLSHMSEPVPPPVPPTATQKNKPRRSPSKSYTRTVVPSPPPASPGDANSPHPPEKSTNGAVEHSSRPHRLSERYVMRDGASPRLRENGGRISITTPRDDSVVEGRVVAAALASSTGSRSEKLAPSPPKRPSVARTTGAARSPAPKSRFVRQSVDVQTETSSYRVEDEDFLEGGLFYHQQPLQPCSPSVALPTNQADSQEDEDLMPIDDSIILDDPSPLGKVSTEGEVVVPIDDSVAQSVARELAQLRDQSLEHINSIAEEDEYVDEEEFEAERLRHIHVVVNQMIEEESGILTALTSRIENEKDRYQQISMTRDPLVGSSRREGKGRDGLSLPDACSPKKLMTNYRAVLSKMQEKDKNTILGLSVRDLTTENVADMSESTLSESSLGMDQNNTSLPCINLS